MGLLRRYILRSLLGPFLFALGACTGLMLINQLAKRFGDLVGKDLPWQVIAEVLALSMPFIIALTLPMAVLVAILYGYSQLGSDNEITAMRAGGLSVAQMLRPALLVGTTLAIVNFLFVDQILPRTNTRLRNLQSDIGQKKPAFTMREQMMNELRPYYIRAGRIFAESGRMLDVEIYHLGSREGRRVIYADSGVMAFDTTRTDLLLQLYHGKVHEFKSIEPSRIQVTHFGDMQVRIGEVQNLLERNLESFERGDREMTTCEMMDQVALQERKLARAVASRRDLAERDLRTLLRLRQPPIMPSPLDTTRATHCGKWRDFERAVGKLILPQVAAAADVPPPGRLDVSSFVAMQAQTVQQPRPIVPVNPNAQLPRLDIAPGLATPHDVVSASTDERVARRSVNQFKVEIHKKYTISVACFTFVLIGVPLALRFPRGGMGLVLGGGLAIFAIFYVSMVGGESLADRGLVSAPLAMWAPNIIVFIAGLIGLLRVNREFGSTRGGDLRELLDVFRPSHYRRRESAT